MNNKTMRIALLAIARSARRPRPRSPPIRRRRRTTRSSCRRSTAATSACRSSRRTTSRSASSAAPTRPRTSARARVYGVRLGYHITEDFFVEGVYAADQGERRGVPPDPAGRHLRRRKRTKLSYYNFSVGYNLLPGEIFLGSRTRQAVAALRRSPASAAPSSTSQRRPTFNVGFGYRVFLADWMPRCSSTCATTCSRSTCSASARARRTSSSPAA